MGAWKTKMGHVAWSGLLCSGFMLSVSPLVAQEPQPRPGTSLGDTATRSELSDLPDSPGATIAKLGEPQQQSASPQSPATSSGSPQTTQPPPSPTQSQTAPQRPVGTAASEAPSASGVAASQPAGVAIAPAKQRRVRTIVLRTGAIIAAGVAVGSVVALTAATSSKPPGAH